MVALQIDCIEVEMFTHEGSNWRCADHEMAGLRYVFSIIGKASYMYVFSSSLFTPCEALAKNGAKLLSSEKVYNKCYLQFSKLFMVSDLN